jgi:hypothetical protein
LAIFIHGMPNIDYAILALTLHCIRVVSVAPANGPGLI